METRSGTDRGASYDPSTTPPPAEKSSVVEDFIDINYAPSTVFARRQNSGFGVQLLIVTVLAALFAVAMRSVMGQIADAEFAKQSAKMLAQNPQLTPEALQTGAKVQRALALFGSVVGTPIIIFVIGLVLWLSAKIVSAKITYKQAVLITTLAWVPRLIASLITTLQVVLTDTSNITAPFALSFSPARFMDPDANRMAYILAGNFDVFAIWYTVLLGIGVATIAKVSRGKGYAAAAIVFVVSSIPLLIGAFAQK